MPKITSETRLRQIAEENEMFVRSLRSTGNATAAARSANRSRETFAGRRRADVEFDARCEAALVFARAALARKGGAKPAADGGAGGGLVAASGENMVGPNLNNGLQVRRSLPGHVTAKGEAAFLEALSATASIRLSAEAIGVDPRAFYKRRAQSPDFARRMQAALAAGYEAVEFALVRTALRTLAPGGDAADEASDALESVARMSVDQAMTLIATRAKTIAIGERHIREPYRKLPTPEETDALLMKRLELLARKKARQKALAETGRQVTWQRPEGQRPEGQRPEGGGEG